MPIQTASVDDPFHTAHWPCGPSPFQHYCETKKGINHQDQQVMINNSTKLICTVMTSFVCLHVCVSASVRQRC